MEVLGIFLEGSWKYVRMFLEGSWKYVRMFLEGSWKYVIMFSEDSREDEHQGAGALFYTGETERRGMSGYAICNNGNKKSYNVTMITSE